MVLERCEVCNEIILGRHTCPPEWKVLEREIPSRAREIYAQTTEEAALIFVQEMDLEYDMEVARGQGIYVIVENVITKEFEEFFVSGEMAPHYYAELLQ